MLKEIEYEAENERDATSSLKPFFLKSYANIIAQDFFVASYPKCGTTWCQYIVHLIRNDGVPLLHD
jgi:hypothetical protein